MRNFSAAEIADFRTNPDANVSYCNRWTPLEIEQLTSEYLSGETITDIAMDHSRTESAIMNRLKRESLVFSKSHKPDWC